MENHTATTQHSHNHSHGHDHVHDSGKNIAVAFFLNFSFTIIEAVGGLLTNSIAILSDAVHDFGDCISLGLAWYFDKVAKKKPSARYTYGYKRFSLLGALINCIVLFAGSAWVIYESVTRLFDPQEVAVTGMFWLSVGGIIVNGAAVLKTRSGKGVNERVVSLHLLEDVLGWVAVFIVSIVMMFVNLPILDPILSLGISVFIIINVVKNLNTTMKVILQGIPDNYDPKEFVGDLLQLDNLVEVHDLHVWSLDSEYNIASMHVVVNDWNHEALVKLKHQIKEITLQHNINHVTVEFETSNEICERCD